MAERKRASLSAADADTVRDWMTLRPATKPLMSPDAGIDMFLDNALSFLVCGLEDEVRPQARIIRSGVSPVRGRHRSTRKLHAPEHMGLENSSSRLYSEESRQAYLQENFKQARVRAMDALPAGTAILPFDQRGKAQARRDSSEVNPGEGRPSSFTRQDRQAAAESGGHFDDDAGRAREQAAGVLPQSRNNDDDRSSRQSMPGSSQSPPPRPPSSSVSVQCKILKTFSPRVSMPMPAQRDSSSNQSPPSEQNMMATSPASDTSKRASTKTYVPVLRTGSNGVWR
jgi:hypothetical protein